MESTLIRFLSKCFLLQVTFFFLKLIGKCFRKPKLTIIYELFSIFFNRWKYINLEIQILLPILFLCYVLKITRIAVYLQKDRNESNIKFSKLKHSWCLNDSMDWIHVWCLNYIIFKFFKTSNIFCCLFWTNDTLLNIWVKKIRMIFWLEQVLW